MFTSRDTRFGRTKETGVPNARTELRVTRTPTMCWAHHELGAVAGLGPRAERGSSGELLERAI